MHLTKRQGVGYGYGGFRGSVCMGILWDSHGIFLWVWDGFGIEIQCTRHPWWAVIIRVDNLYVRLLDRQNVHTHKWWRIETERQDAGQLSIRLYAELGVRRDRLGSIR